MYIPTSETSSVVSVPADQPPADKLAEYKEIAEKALPHIGLALVVAVGACVLYKFSRFAGGRAFRGARGLYRWAASPGAEPTPGGPLAACLTLLDAGHDSLWEYSDTTQPSGEMFAVGRGGARVVIGGLSRKTAWMLRNDQTVVFSSAAEEKRLRRAVYETLTRLRDRRAAELAVAAAAKQREADAATSEAILRVLDAGKPAPAPVPPAAPSRPSTFVEKKVDLNQFVKAAPVPAAPPVSPAAAFRLAGQAVNIYKATGERWSLLCSVPEGLDLATDAEVERALRESFKAGRFRVVATGLDPATAPLELRATFTVEEKA